MRVGPGASNSGDICNGALPLSLSEQISPSFSGLDWEGLAPQPQGLLGLSPGHRVLPKPLLHPCRVGSASAPVYTGVRALGGPQPLPYTHSTPRVGALTRESPLATIVPLLRSPSIYSGPQHFHPPLLVVQLLTERPESRRRDSAEEVPAPHALGILAPSTPCLQTRWHHCRYLPGDRV